MVIQKIMQKMIADSKGSLHDINHFIKVWSYAQTIGKLEQIGEENQLVLEAAALVHDIACPTLRAKYGCSDGKKQEIEGMPMARDLLAEFVSSGELTQEQFDRIAYLVGHHHTLDKIEGIDYQILIEADYIVNADESRYSKENIKNFKEKIFSTESGTEILESIYGV